MYGGSAMRGTINDKFYEEINVLRGIVKMDQMIPAFLLINEVRQAMKEGSLAETAEELYALLLLLSYIYQVLYCIHQQPSLVPSLLE